MRLRRGFTLVELLVVISIMAILTVVAVSQFNTAKIKARDTQRKTDIDAVAKAIDMYYADYGMFPEQEMLDWGGEFTDDSDGSDYVYMKVLPSESRLDSQYCYLPSNDQTSYLLFANMEGDGAVTGDYAVNSDQCDDEYNFVKTAANTTVDEFCNQNGTCGVGELPEPTPTDAGIGLPIERG